MIDNLVLIAGIVASVLCALCALRANVVRGRHERAATAELEDRPSADYCAGCDRVDKPSALDMHFTDQGLYRCSTCDPSKRVLRRRAKKVARELKAQKKRERKQRRVELTDSSVYRSPYARTIECSCGLTHVKHPRGCPRCDERRRVHCVDCNQGLADTVTTFPEFDHQVLCWGCVRDRRTAADRPSLDERTARHEEIKRAQQQREAFVNVDKVMADKWRHVRDQREIERAQVLSIAQGSNIQMNITDDGAPDGSFIYGTLTADQVKVLYAAGAITLGMARQFIDGISTTQLAADAERLCRNANPTPPLEQR